MKKFGHLQQRPHRRAGGNRLQQTHQRPVPPCAPCGTYSKRHAIADFVYLARDTPTPYVDNRPLKAAGKPEIP
jgi:hypothetical protein